MRVAVVGPEALAVCRAAGTDAAIFPTLRAAAPRDWALLALTPRAIAERSAPKARCLLLPGDRGVALARRAAQVVDYGFSPRDTLTLSGARMLSLQRSVVTLGGRLVEPQELPLDAALAALPDEQAMLAALLRLLCDA